MDKEKNITNDPTRIYSDRKVETKTGNLSEPFRVSNDRKKQCCRSQDLRWKELRGPGGAPPFKPQSNPATTSNLLMSEFTHSKMIEFMMKIT